MLLARGDAAAAEPLAATALSTREAKLAADHPDRHDSALLLARIATARGQIDHAEGALRALEAVARAQTTSPTRAARWHRASAELAVARGDVSGAASSVDARLAALASTLDADHPHLAVARVARACLALRVVDIERAIQLAAAARAPIEGELSPLAAARGELSDALEAR